MHKHIIKQLKNLRTIEPDNGFVLRTRNIFTPTTTTTPPRSFSFFNWRYASAFAFVLICVVLTVPFFAFTPEETLASLDTKLLASEIQSLPINVELKELNYNQKAQDIITIAVSEVSNTYTSHLNESLILKEEEIIKAEKEVSSNIDDLLKQVIQ